jgi:hypothetical protein
MSLQGLADSLAGTAASAALVDRFWVVPTMQSIHIVAVAFVFAGTLVLGARTWGLIDGRWTPERWGRRLLPGIWGALAMLLLTGALLVLAEPARELPNPSFQAKMVALLAAVPVTLWLGRRLRSTPGTDAVTRALAALLVLLWLFVIAAGRWIAYT